jgi:tetratricopeptide (TPR) repeat protein
LHKQGQLAEAVRAYRKAITLQPKYALAYTNLGFTLRAQGKLAEAEAASRKAIALEPRLVLAYNHLGIALEAQGKVAEAMQTFRQAIALQPDFAEAHANLGLALLRQGKRTEAVQAFRDAVSRRPDFAAGYFYLGYGLHSQGKLADAVRAFRKAIALKPDYAAAYNNLGSTLHAQGKLAEAEEAGRQAVALTPNSGENHYNLGNHLSAQRKKVEAIKAYRRAIVLQPNHAEAHCNLGHALLGRGEFAEGLTVLKRGHELGSQRRAWPYPSAGWVQQAERLVQLDKRLATVLSDKVEPANAAERIALAELCQKPFKQFYSAAAHFYAEAFAAEPQWANNIRARHRYNAACAAALAGCGRGKDAAALRPVDRARLRGQALVWLRADLDHWAKQLAAATPQARAAVLQTLQHWQNDADLAGLRDPAGLAQLPQEERKAWAKLWQEIAVLGGKTLGDQTQR